MFGQAELDAICFASKKSDPRPSKRATAQDWHEILGHVAKEALSHLEAHTTGATITHQNAPQGSKCESCALSKATRIISTRSGHTMTGDGMPFERVSCDTVYHKPSVGSNRYSTHLVCVETGYHLVSNHWGIDQVSQAIEEFVMQILAMGYKIRFMKTDDFKNTSFNRFLKSHGIIRESSAPHTQSQNGAAESAGKLLTRIARTLRIHARLPANLWPENVKCAAYLLNMWPTRRLGWRTPFEAVTSRKPDLAHLQVYGCRAYPLRYNVAKLDKLEPRAHIGYLVGYDSSNIFRVWIPSKKKVIRTRDVTFDGSRFYHPGEADLGLVVSIEDTINVIPPLPSLNDGIEETLNDDFRVPEPDLAGESVKQSHSEPTVPQIELANKNSGPECHQLPTPATTAEPESTPNEAQAVAQQVVQSQHHQAQRPSYYFETSAESTTVSADLDESNIVTGKRKRVHKAFVTQTDHLAGFLHGFGFALSFTSSTNRTHSSELPDPPKNWQQLLRHPHCTEFIAAAEKEYRDVSNGGTFQFVEGTQIDSSIQALPLVWVFTYKFDQDGFLVKHKARICVRGDLQVTMAETRATTLAARIFRFLMAIIAAFGLEMRQYDVVNAFINAHLQETVYTYHPDGFYNNGLIKLRRALYGLRQAPALWQAEFSSTLESFGFSPIPDIPCLFVADGILVFFYVDDIIVACHPTPEARKDMAEFEVKLANRYNIKRIGKPEWFLGIRILHDQANNTLSLVQDAYIEKVADRFHLTHRKQPSTPMPVAPLVASTSRASPEFVFTYQQKVGCINFAATTSRPDIAKAVSLLSEHLQNPSQQCMDAVDQVVGYLYHTRHHGIQFQGAHKDPIFSCWSDASFADDSATRKSSEAFVFMLYGGPIDWHATKQKTVTTSTTEAELLALSGASREMMWWRRFFEAIEFNPEQPITINCDNAQTVDLMKKETPRLLTKLRHVDIHQCWLRQQVQGGIIDIKWVPTRDMHADGFTKLLGPQAHQHFVSQLGLVDHQQQISKLSKATPPSNELSRAFVESKDMVDVIT
jgi:hypothetical protein